MSFRDLKPGDHVIRMLAGVLPMEMRVLRIEGDTLVCFPVEASDFMNESDPGSCYTFNRDNGGEIDLELGWNPPHTMTGSILKRIVKQ